MAFARLLLYPPDDRGASETERVAEAFRGCCVGQLDRMDVVRDDWGGREVLIDGGDVVCIWNGGWQGRCVQSDIRV